ncbi:MAG: hypothetical protein WDN24_17070 [Sphingomonas sp.]
MRMKKALAPLAFPLLLSAAQGDSTPTLRVAPDKFQERDLWASVADNGARAQTLPVVLPDMAAGVTSSPIDAPTGYPVVLVAGIGGKDRLLCLHMRSADGFYEATARVALPPVAREIGRARIVLPSAATRIAQLTAGELAVTANASPDLRKCGAWGTFLDIGWSQGRASGHGLTALVGGAGTSAWPEIRRTDEDAALACRPVPNRGRSQAAFRFACTIAPRDCRAIEKLLVDWKSGKRRTPGFALTIRRSCT